MALLRIALRCWPCIHGIVTCRHFEIFSDVKKCNLSLRIVCYLSPDRTGNGVKARKRGAETGSNFAVCHQPKQVGRAPTSNIHASHEPRDMLENRIDDARAVIGTAPLGGGIAAAYPTIAT